MQASEKKKYQRKNLIYAAVLISLMGAVYLYRTYVSNAEPEPKLFKISGTTMGVVPYNISYISTEEQDLKPGIENLLKKFNQSLSTYIEDSEISRFNREGRLEFESSFFYPVLLSSRKIFEATDGAFDPSIMPLTNAWGFGPGEKKDNLPQSQVDSLRAFVDFNQVAFNRKNVWTRKEGVKLDFSAIAKGFAVDILANHLSKAGFKNFMIEIGGEVRCSGFKFESQPWIIGITEPREAEDGKVKAAKALELMNRSVATSGNYYNFRMVNGKKVSHTLSPKTGYPVEHSLLSASVIAEDCMTADAYATAFMVIGKDSALNIAENTPNLEALFIYDDNGTLKTAQTKGMEELFIVVEEPK